MRNHNKKALTPAQKHFADQYLICHNGAAAYRIAYPHIRKNETAWVNASRLLRKAKVAAYIKAKQTEIAAKYDITLQRTLQEESFIAFADISQAFKGGVLMHPDQLPEELRRAVRDFEIIDQADGSRKYKYHFWDKGRALERLGKHLGLYEKDNRQKGPSLSEVFAALSVINSELAQAVKERLEEYAAAGSADPRATSDPK